MEHPVKRTEVKSSNVSEVGFCPECNGIYVLFGNSLYKYPGNQKLFDDLMAADSKGSFVHNSLKPLGHKKIG